MIMQGVRDGREMDGTERYDCMTIYLVLDSDPVNIGSIWMTKVMIHQLIGKEYCRSTASRASCLERVKRKTLGG